MLYYAVLVERKATAIGGFEWFLYVWIAAFAYDEFGDITDAGMLFYRMDFWSTWNLGIIGTGAVFFITSEFPKSRRLDPAAIYLHGQSSSPSEAMAPAVLLTDHCISRNRGIGSG